MWDVEDTYDPECPPFRPHRPAGLHLPSGLENEADFVRLFLTPSQIEKIVNFTNQYADANISNFTSYQNKDKKWTPTTSAEMYKFFGLLIYTSVVHVGNFRKMWSRASLLNGMWARAFIPSRDRALGILRFLQVTNHAAQNAGDKLRSIRQFYDHFRSRCSALYQPRQHLAVDERMVKCKGRFSYRQFLPSKPIRFGFKLYVIAESPSGYTLDFEVYVGHDNAVPGVQGKPASQAVVERLM